MAVIEFVINQNTSRSANVNRITRPQRAVLRQVGPNSPKRTLSFPYGPQGVTFSGDALRYEVTNRPGAKPILTAVGGELRTVGVNALLADKGTQGKNPIESQMAVLQSIAAEPYDCTFTYGVSALPYRVRISNIDFTAIQRNADGNITQAEASFELKESVQPNQSIVTLTAITYDPPPKPADSSKTGSPSTSDNSTTLNPPPDDIWIPPDPNNTPFYSKPGSNQVVG